MDLIEKKIKEIKDGYEDFIEHVCPVSKCYPFRIDLDKDYGYVFGKSKVKTFMVVLYPENVSKYSTFVSQEDDGEYFIALSVSIKDFYDKKPVINHEMMHMFQSLRGMKAKPKDKLYKERVESTEHKAFAKLRYLLSDTEISARVHSCYTYLSDMHTTKDTFKDNLMGCQDFKILKKRVSELIKTLENIKDHKKFVDDLNKITKKDSPMSEDESKEWLNRKIDYFKKQEKKFYNKLTKLYDLFE